MTTAPKGGRLNEPGKMLAGEGAYPTFLRG
jgi:hypothetical protein